MHPFADPSAHRRLQRLVADAHPRGPQIFVQLLTDVAGRIGGQPAIIAALTASAGKQHAASPLSRTSRA